MLVTATEAYLQDALAFAAERDTRLMKDSELSATYEQITSAQSLEDLAGELRDRWARGFVDKGGPRSWKLRLERMGARGYVDGVEELLETLWGLRHIIVHRAGIATVDFVRRHPSFDAKRGERVKLNRNQMLPYLDAIANFVETTELYLIQRLATL